MYLFKWILEFTVTTGEREMEVCRSIFKDLLFYR